MAKRKFSSETKSDEPMKKAQTATVVVFKNDGSGETAEIVNDKANLAIWAKNGYVPKA